MSRFVHTTLFYSVLFNVLLINPIPYYLLPLHFLSCYILLSVLFCIGDVDKPNVTYASLGAHMSLIALTVFISFGVSLSARLVEIEFNISHKMVRTHAHIMYMRCSCQLVSVTFFLHFSFFFSAIYVHFHLFTALFNKALFLPKFPLFPYLIDSINVAKLMARKIILNFDSFDLILHFY